LVGVGPVPVGTSAMAMVGGGRWSPREWGTSRQPVLSARHWIGCAGLSGLRRWKVHFTLVVTRYQRFIIADATRCARVDIAEGQWSLVLSHAPLDAQSLIALRSPIPMTARR